MGVASPSELPVRQCAEVHVIPVERLRWTVGGQDVTCENCHTAMYRLGKDDTLCPTCLAALGQDVMSVHAHMSDLAAERTKQKVA